MLKLSIALLSALLVADEPPFTIGPDRMLDARVQQMPARLRVDPGAPSLPIFSPEFAARAGFQSGWIGVEARIGPVRVSGRTAVIRYDLGSGEFKRRTAWFTSPFLNGADGTIGPGGLPAPVVRFDLRAPRPGEREVVLPLASFASEGMGVRLPLGGYSLRVLFAVHRARTLATASAGAVIADAQGGTLDGAPERMPIHFGVERPVRHLSLRTPLAVGPFAVSGLIVRTSDFGSTAGIREAGAPEPDPDEVIVTAKKKQKELTLEIGRDYLDRCSSITFDKPRKRLTFSCR